MNIAIIDDDKQFVEKLQNHLVDLFSKDVHLDFVAIYECNKVLFKDLQSDIIFIDIDLKDSMTGIDIGQSIKKHTPNSILIFMSNQNEFVFSTFVADPFDFLRKNHFHTDLKAIVSRISEQLTCLGEIDVIISGRKKKILVGDVQYIMSLGHLVLVQTKTGSHTVRSSLTSFVNNHLKENNLLVQINASTVINLQCILKREQLVITTYDNKKYTIGRKYKVNFMEKYTDYLMQ